jgi:hypothetical protein
VIIESTVRRFLSEHSKWNEQAQRCNKARILPHRKLLISRNGLVCLCAAATFLVSLAQGRMALEDSCTISGKAVMRNLAAP